MLMHQLQPDLQKRTEKSKIYQASSSQKSFLLGKHFFKKKRNLEELGTHQGEIASESTLNMTICNPQSTCNQTDGNKSSNAPAS
jgi:hypothetical protein